MDEIEKLKTDHDIACCAYLCASDTLDDARKARDAASANYETASANYETAYSIRCKAIDAVLVSARAYNKVLNEAVEEGFIK